MQGKEKASFTSALASFVSSLISKTSKAFPLPFFYQRLKTKGFLADTKYNNTKIKNIDENKIWIINCGDDAYDDHFV